MGGTKSGELTEKIGLELDHQHRRQLSDHEESSEGDAVADMDKVLWRLGISSGSQVPVDVVKANVAPTLSSADAKRFGLENVRLYSIVCVQKR